VRILQHAGKRSHTGAADPHDMDVADGVGKTVQRG
jgi:hypothetical protein